MRYVLLYVIALVLATACNEEKPQTIEQLERQSTPISLSGKKNHDGPNPHANLSPEQHVEVAMQHAEQGRMEEALDVLNRAGVRTGWRSDVMALVSAQRFEDARDKLKEYCIGGKNGEVCLVLAAAYFDGEARFGIASREIVEAYRYTRHACENGSEAGCTASKAAIEKGELLQNVLFEPGVRNRDAQLKEAIQLGADLNVTTLFTATLLQQAISEERIEAVRLLLQNGADVNYTVSDHDPTPLIYAINSGKKEMVSLLLDNGADPAKTMKVADYLKMGKEEANACDFARKLESKEMTALLKCKVATATSAPE